MTEVHEPDDLNDNLKGFWRLSFEMQISLGKSETEARAHADDYIAQLKATDAGKRLGDGVSWDDPRFEASIFNKVISVDGARLLVVNAEEPIRNHFGPWVQVHDEVVVCVACTETTDDHWVRVMADYSSDGVWQRDGCMMSRDDLPISPALLIRHKAWCDCYDVQCEDYLPPEARTKNFDSKAFSEEGLRISKAIKAELPNWTVIYFDEGRIDRDHCDQQDRAEFEYEIAV